MSARVVRLEVPQPLAAEVTEALSQAGWRIGTDGTHAAARMLAFDGTQASLSHLQRAMLDAREAGRATLVIVTSDEAAAQATLHAWPSSWTWLPWPQSPQWLSLSLKLATEQAATVLGTESTIGEPGQGARRREARSAARREHGAAQADVGRRFSPAGRARGAGLQPRRPRT